MKTAKILICYNSPVSIFSVYNGKPSDKPSLTEAEGNISTDLSEAGFSSQIGKIRKTLQNYFSSVDSFAVDRNINHVVDKLNSYSPDIIFNLVESVEGISEYEYCNVGLFELLGFQYTGNTPICLGNCLNKERAKTILRSFNLNTPDSIVLGKNTNLSEEKFSLKFSLILKLLKEDASIGISELSVIHNFNDFKNHLDFLFKTYDQEVLAEEYIDGRELNVAVLGNKVLPVSEILFDGLPEDLPKIVTYDGKWMEDSVYYNYTKPKCPAELDSKIKKEVEETALAAFEAMGCRDYARIDIRLDKENKPFVIEVNPNPDISEDSGFARAAEAAGLSHTDLLLTILNFSLTRLEHDKKNKAI
jgi:D-alanine-D-alanine ligase